MLKKIKAHSSFKENNTKKQTKKSEIKESSDEERKTTTQFESGHKCLAICRRAKYRADTA